MSKPIRIRASSIASIIDCPKRGLSIALGLVKQLPSTAPAAIGTACHEGTAAFDRAWLNGDQIEPYDVSYVVKELIDHPHEEVYWGSIPKKTALARAMGVFTKYCNDIAPNIFYSAVELKLEPIVAEVEGVVIKLTGTLDRIYTENLLSPRHTDLMSPPQGILDIKTGARVMSTKPGKHKAQLGVYELLAEATTGFPVNLPGLIGQLQTSADYDADIVGVSDSKVALLGTDETPGLLHHIARMLDSGDFYGNASSWLCSEQYCPLYNNCFFR